MYQRMLNKNERPTEEEMAAYCGPLGDSFCDLNDFLTRQFATAKEIRFPYGNSYGWGVCHRRGKGLICDIFAEDGAFNVMLRLTNEGFAAVYDRLTPEGQACVDGRYPCGGGGWVHYRVTDDGGLRDIKVLLTQKFAGKKAAK